MPLFRHSSKERQDEHYHKKHHTKDLTVKTHNGTACAETPSPAPLDNRKQWDSMQSIEEALEGLASDHPPRVARSIPKGIFIDSSKIPDKSMQHCLYDRPVYDQMLADSINVCELLQNNFDTIIARVQTPTPGSDAPDSTAPAPAESKKRLHFGKPKEKQQKPVVTETSCASKEQPTSSPSKGSVHFDDDGVNDSNVNSSFDKEHSLTTISERTEPIEPSSRQQEPPKREKKSWFSSKKRTAVTIK